MAKRILHDFKLNAIAVVDRPAQEHALATIRKSADEPRPVGKAAKLRDLKILELSLVDRPANVDALATIVKRDSKRGEPAPVNLGNPAAQRTALEALERLINKSRSEPHSPTLDEALAKACPARQNAAADEVHALAEQYADKNGCSYAQAYDHLAKTQPDLVAKAISGGDA